MRLIFDFTPLKIIGILLIVLGLIIFLINGIVFYKFFKFNTHSMLSLIFEFFLTIIFSASLIFLIIGIVKLTEFENTTIQTLDDFIEKINQYAPGSENMPSDLIEKCKALKNISRWQECCGSTSINSFTTGFEKQCCSLSDTGYKFENGCTQKIEKYIRINIITLLILPNSIIIAFELFIGVLVALAIVEMSRQGKKDAPIELSNH